MDGMNHASEDDDAAARAFEALREEVAALRRGVELVYRQGHQSAAAVPGAPDENLFAASSPRPLSN
jgi:hypothetical protein